MSFGSSIAIAMALFGSGTAHSTQAKPTPRAGYICILWPGDSKASKASASSLSFVFPTDKFEGHKAEAIELLEVPAFFGNGGRVVKFSSGEKGFGVMFEGARGRFFLMSDPRKGKSGEYDAGLAAVQDDGMPSKHLSHVGACHTMLADEKLIAHLKQQSGS